MAGYIRADGDWRTLNKVFVYANGAWRTVQNGFLYANGAWRQFFSSAATTYTFSFGNTIHIGTNGYISLDSGQSTINIASTTGRVLGILPADLELNSIRYAADSSKFYVFFRGKRLGQTNFEIEYEVHFTDGQDYALIKLVAFPSSTYSLTGYYVNGSSAGNSRITATRTVGAEYRVYFGTTAAFATSFTEYGTSTHPVWLAQSSLTSGNADDGYISVVGNQGSSAQAPTSVTASSVTSNSATVSWAAITNANAGMSAIQSYDYSINGGSSWTSTGTSTSASITGLTPGGISYTVLVRANNYFFTGTNYGSVSFNTLAGAPTITSLTASAPTTTSTQLVLVTVSWTSTNQASYFLNVTQAFVANYLDYGTTETSSSQSHGSGNNFNVYSGASVSISLTVYNGPNQTGDSATSTITYTPPIQVVPTITSLAASSITKTGATLSWSSTNQATYSITGLPSSYSGTTATSRAVSGLSENTSYTATVTVTSSSGDTASANVTFTTLATITPTISNVTASSIGFTGATISWSSTNQATYSITGLPNSYTGTTGTSRSIINLVKGTSYTATVTVTSSSGDTASGSVTFTTLIPNISSITMTPGGASTPYMTATWAATNTASVFASTYRSSSSAVNSPINTFINSTSTNGSTVITNTGGLNFYYQFIIQPWSGINATGESGDGRTTGIKRNTTSGGPTTYTF